MSGQVVELKMNSLQTRDIIFVMWVKKPAEKEERADLERKRNEKL